MSIVLLKPILTEKTNNFGENQYAFQVRHDARKPEIKRAAEFMFGVKVINLRTCTIKEPQKINKFGKTKIIKWKKAYLSVDKAIEIES